MSPPRFMQCQTVLTTQLPCVKGDDYEFKLIDFLSVEASSPFTDLFGFLIVDRQKEASVSAISGQLDVQLEEIGQSAPRIRLEALSHLDERTLEAARAWACQDAASYSCQCRSSTRTIRVWIRSYTGTMQSHLKSVAYAAQMTLAQLLGVT